MYCHLVKILNIKHLTLEKVQMSSVTTRSSKSCVILEMVSCLQENNLPTINNVLGYILYVEKEKSNNTKTLNADLRFAAIDEVVNKVLYIWKKASIPTASKQQAIFVVRKLFKQRRNLLKKTNTKNFTSNVEELKNKWNVLFDIAACKCLGFSSCNCKTESKVTELIASLKLLLNLKKKCNLGAS